MWEKHPNRPAEVRRSFPLENTGIETQRKQKLTKERGKEFWTERVAYAKDWRWER